MDNLIYVLMKLAFVSAILTVALEQIYDTDLFNKLINKIAQKMPLIFKTENSTGIRDLTPWISTLFGIYIAYAFNIQALYQGLEINNSDQVKCFSPILDTIFTGMIIGGGTKTITRISNHFMKSKECLK